MRQLRENLLVQFTVVSLLVLALVAVVLSVTLARSMRASILERVSREAVDTLSQRVAHRLTPQDLEQPMTGERYDEFHRFVKQSIVSARTARIKLWNSQGQVIYSGDRAQVGESFPIKPHLAQALAGGVAQEISVPKEAENVRERVLGTLIEVYAPLTLPGSTKVVGSLEIYQFYAPYAAHIDGVRRNIFLFLGLGFLFLYLSLVFIVARGWRLITWQRRQIEARSKELSALNGLLQADLERHWVVLEELEQLSKAPVTSDDDVPASLTAFYQQTQKVKELAERAAAFPRLSR